MKSIAMFSCLLLSTSMFTCDDNPATIMKKKGAEVAANKVQINSCKPDLDQVKVHDGDTFTWSVAQVAGPPDTNSYDVIFLGGRTPIGTASVTATPAQPAQATIQKDAECKRDSRKCYYPYMLLQKQSGSGGHTTFCQDPGMHIIP